MSKKKSVFYGIAFILVALAILGQGMGLFGSIPLVKVILTACMGVWAITDLILYRQFLRPLVFIGIILCLFKSEIGMQNLNYFMIMLTTVLLGIGLEMIFHAGKTHIFRSGNSLKKFTDPLTGRVSLEDEEGNYSNGNGVISIDSDMRPFTAYLTDEEIQVLNIDSGMGPVTVYVGEGCKLLPGAVANIDSGMSPVDVYFPASWRLQVISQDGLVNFTWDRLQENLPEDAPVLKLNLDSGMSPVNIHKQTAGETEE